MRSPAVTFCAEFPNDNADLHLGAVWVCLDVTGPAVCERTAPLEELLVEVEEPLPEPLVEIEAMVEELVSPQVPEAAVEPPCAADLVAPPPAVVELPTDPAPPVLEAEDTGDDIEIVDEIVMDEVIDESSAPAPPVASDDPFVALVQVLHDVAAAAGATKGAMALLRTLVGQERLADDSPTDVSSLRAQASGWQAILGGESEDFSLVNNSQLDEWASRVVACALGEPARADGLRRELRRRGVAAFGIVIESAA